MGRSVETKGEIVVATKLESSSFLPSETGMASEEIIDSVADEEFSKGEINEVFSEIEVVTISAIGASEATDHTAEVSSLRREKSAESVSLLFPIS